MIPIIPLSYVFRLLSFLFLFADFSNKDPSITSQNENGFAVFELFTSEGCSRCPSTDAVMIELSKRFPSNVYFPGYRETIERNME